MNYPAKFNSSSANFESRSNQVLEKNTLRRPAPGFAYTGCYTSAGRNGLGEGINIFVTDSLTGKLTHLRVLNDFNDPSFLALNGLGDHLYCVDAGQATVSAFLVNNQTGQLSWLNTQATGGTNPVALCLDRSNRFLFVANYSSGSISTLPINPDGSLKPLCDLIQLQGEPGPDKVEQSSSHPHDINFDLEGRYLMVPDKGFDRIFVYSFDPGSGRLHQNDVPSVALEPGAGPRHLAFHPGGLFVYVINELNSTVTTLSYDNSRRFLQPVQVISTLPTGFTDKNTGAEIKITPSGRFLYASNRGNDSIVVYEINQLTGILNPLKWEPTQGKTPRYFNIDPEGKFLYACNQDSNTIVAFKLDQQTGFLKPTGQPIETGSPVCIIFTRQVADL